jgi:mono/diheme cytochrome c family protein
MACSLVLLLATLIAGPATANDNGVAAGRALVEMYCTDCHATGPTGDSPLSIAPRFRDLYLRYNVEHLSEALVEGIVTAHPDMPPFEFDPEQAEAIIVYLKTLEPVPPAGDPAKADE